MNSSKARSFSLRRDLLRGLALIALLPALLLGLSGIFQSYWRERQHLNESLMVSTMLSASAIEHFIQSHLSAVSLLAESEPNRSWNRELAELHSQYPSFITVLATDDAGRIIGAYPEAGRTGRSVADRAYFGIPARTHKNFVSDAFIGRGFGTDPLVAVSAPIVENGRFHGVVEGSIHIKEFTKLRSRALGARGYEMLILDRESKVLHTSEGLPFRFQQDLSKAKFLERRIDHFQVMIGRTNDASIGGSRTFVAQTRMKWGWRLLLLVPESSLFGPLARRLGVFFAVLTIVVAGAMVAIRLVMRRFDASAQRILVAFQALARNDPVSHLSMSEIPAELMPLAESINHLAGRLSVVESDNVQLARLSRTDPLTGVLNRRGIDAELHWLHGERTGSETVAVLAFDIDLFKAFNDEYGHLAGDTALRRVAGAISGCLRSPTDVLGRTGGEEFVAMLPDADLPTALAVAERARLTVSGLAIPNARAPTGCLTISVGVFVASGAASTHSLLERADKALYRAKRNGRNQVATIS